MECTTVSIESHKTPLTPALISSSLNINFTREDWYDAKDKILLAKMIEFDDSNVTYNNVTFLGDYNTTVHMELHSGTINSYNIIKLLFIKCNKIVKDVCFMSLADYNNLYK